MSTTQSIFVVFYAIFWGAIFNVQGRWLAFQPVWSHARIRRRWILSFALLNVAPALFFAWTFYRLRGEPIALVELGPAATIRELCVAVFSAFWVFGFYRLWQAIVQACPSTFYWRASDQPRELKGHDPTMGKVHLGHKLWVWNFASAALYFAFGGLAPCFR